MKTVNKTISCGVLKFSVPVGMIESVKEAIDQGGEARVVEALNDGWPKFGATGLVVRTVKELTKIEPKTKKTKNAKGVMVTARDLSTDGDSAYVQRALKSVPSVTVDAVNAELAKRSTLKVSLAPVVKQGPKLSNKFVTLATEYLAGTNPKRTLAGLNQRLQQNGLPTITANGEPDKNINTVGRALEALTALLV